MRRIQLLMSAMLMAVLFTACGGQSQTTEQTTGAGSDVTTQQEQQSEDTTEATSEETQTASGNLAIDVSYQYYESENEDGYFWGSYELPKVLGEQYATLSEAVAKWAADYETSYLEQAANYEAEAQQYAEEGDDSEFYGYSFSSTIKVARADERVASITVDESAYTGGVHGSAYLYGVNLDSQTGEIIKFSDLGDIRQDVIMYLQDYFTDNPSDLFSADECLEIFEEKLGNDDAWYLTGEGLAIVFNEYEINSYAAGRSVVIVPYAELTAFNQAYVPADGVGFTQLYENKPMYIDVNADGDAETVTLSVYYSEDGGSDIELSVGDLSLDLGIGEYVSSAYYVRTKDKRSFVLVSGDMASDDYVTQLIELTDGVPKKCDEVEGNIAVMSNAVVYLDCSVYVLGTYSSRRSYTFTNGSLEPQETAYILRNNAIENSVIPAPTLKQALKVRVGASEDSELTEEELPAGTVIYPCMYDGETKVGFRLADGRYGELTIEWTDDGIVIDGKLEWDLFDNLPYAG